MQDTWVQSLGWEDPLQKEMATHSSVLAWRSHGQDPGRLQSTGLQRVRHDLATERQTKMTTTQFCCCVKTAIEETSRNGHGCVTIQLYFWKQI